MKKIQTSIRMSEEASRLREALSLELGLSKSAVFELAIRELANRVARDRAEV